jgi:signal transduction histidine kinase
LIELHQGKIWVSSEGKGKGASFTFSLKIFNPVDMEKINEKYKLLTKPDAGLIHKQIE